MAMRPPQMHIDGSSFRKGREEKVAGPEMNCTICICHVGHTEGKESG